MEARRSPTEFWELTRNEVSDVLFGGRIADYWEYRRLMSLLPHLYSMAGSKHPPTMYKLMGSPPEWDDE